MACLAYFSAQPIFSLRVEQEQDIAALSAFLITSIIITGLAAKVRRRSEEELRDTRAQLTRFARVAILGELTASIAHEINQPLAGVVSSGVAWRRCLAYTPLHICGS